MWKHLLSHPLVVRELAWAISALLAVWALLKAKVIRATADKVMDMVSAKFWGWVYGKMMSHHSPRDSSERTYRGIFQDQWYASTPHPMNFFKITHDGVTTTVPIASTSLLFGLKKGTLVEIDTEVSEGFPSEMVKRVRVIEAKKNA